MLIHFVLNQLLLIIYDFLFHYVTFNVIAHHSVAFLPVVSPTASQQDVGRVTNHSFILVCTCAQFSLFMHNFLPFFTQCNSELRPTHFALQASEWQD